MPYKYRKKRRYRRKRNMVKKRNTIKEKESQPLKGNSYYQFPLLESYVVKLYKAPKRLCV